MLPLGGAWSGECRALAGDVFQPASPETERRCNLGYARGECSRFPAGEGPDAVRFTITSDDGPVLRLYYVAERDHHPFAYGALEYSRDSQAIAPMSAAAPVAISTEALAAQASAYAASYIRRKSEASPVPRASRKRNAR
jgi:hypothetical protein